MTFSSPQDDHLLSEKVRFLFWLRVDRSDLEGCWPWTGGLHRKNGVGSLRLDGRLIYARQLAWWLEKVEVPRQVLVQTCGQKNCCNPAHMKLGDRGEVARLREAQGKGGHSSKTHCPQGHPYDEMNTLWRKNGSRGCLACRREQSLARYYATRPEPKQETSREQVFWDRVDIRGPEECWEWKAGRSGEGYGCFFYRGQQMAASRVAWILW
jgi:hypothetical protein